MLNSIILPENDSRIQKNAPSTSFYCELFMLFERIDYICILTFIKDVSRWTEKFSDRIGTVRDKLHTE